MKENPSLKKRQMIESSKLRPKQKRFVAEYLIDLNATQAAIRAGYSAKSAETIGRQLLRKTTVSAALAEAQRQQHARLILTADEVREQNACIARLDPAEMFDANGALLPVAEMPRHVRCALRSLKVVRRNLAAGDGVVDETLEVQFWDKGAAIEREYKHFGLLVDRVEVDVNVNVISDRLKAARARLAERRAVPVVDVSAKDEGFA